jgi:hypothetical protein
MTRGKKHTAEQIVNLLRQVEVGIANGNPSPSTADSVNRSTHGLPTIATARWSHLGELGANTGTGGTFGRLPNDPTFQEVDWHRIWMGQFGMPTTKVKKRKSK